MEESNADKAIKALTAALAPKARVKRNGKVESVEAKELVPGDIVIIQFGNIVPADVKLLGKSGSDEVPMQVSIPCLRASAPHGRSCPNSCMVPSFPCSRRSFCQRRTAAYRRMLSLKACL